MAAARTAVPILLVCAVTLIVFTWFGPTSVSGTAVTASWVVAVMLAGLAVVYWVSPPAVLDRRGGFVLIAVIGVLVVCGMNWITGDTSAAAQAFIAFPVLWAAVHLRRPAVAAVTVLALAVDSAVMFHLEEVVAAITDITFFGSVMVVIAVMLVRAGEQQERLIAALHRQATVDSLTGLVNRRVLDDALTTALSGGSGEQGTSLVLVDVDSFKQINDQHGHPVGDDVLVHVATVLRSVVRAGDAVLSRMGGDELAVLLPACSTEVAARRAGEVLDAVRSTPLVLDDGTAVPISVSLGVAHAPLHADGLEALYAAADAALYVAKRTGRGRVAVSGAA